MASTRYSPLAVSLGLFFLLLAWQIGSLIIESELILPGPVPVFLSLIDLLASRQFFDALWASSWRTLLSFSISLLISIPLGLAAGYSLFFRGFLLPIIAVPRSTPVISVIILGLIWFSPSQAPIWVCLLMIIPMMVQSVQEGVIARDKQLEEMGRSFNLSRIKILYSITFPGLIPFLRSGGRAALGVAWKVVAAAEVLSMPTDGLGSMLQNARMWLETGKVLAVTVAILLISAIGDAMLSIILRVPGSNPLEVNKKIVASQQENL
jgi:NitT/TauT family transport system permease protein